MTIEQRALTPEEAAAWQNDVNRRSGFDGFQRQSLLGGSSIQRCLCGCGAERGRCTEAKKKAQPKHWAEIAEMLQAQRNLKHKLVLAEAQVAELQRLNRGLEVRLAAREARAPACQPAAASFIDPAAIVESAPTPLPATALKHSWAK